MDLIVGEIPVLGGSVSMAALNLLRNDGWDEVQDAISNQSSIIQVRNSLWLYIGDSYT